MKPLTLKDAYPRCNACVYCYTFTDGEYTSSTCRRLPPQMRDHLQNIRAVFPMVHAEHWCSKGSFIIKDPVVVNEYRISFDDFWSRIH
jgi:hypothetical protein